MAATWGRFVLWAEVDNSDIAVVMVKPIVRGDIPAVIAELQDVYKATGGSNPINVTGFGEAKQTYIEGPA